MDPSSTTSPSRASAWDHASPSPRVHTSSRRASWETRTTCRSAGDALVVLELLAPVVLLGARAQHLDDQRRVGHRVLVLGVELARAADDRHVRVRREPGGEHAHAQVGAVEPARPGAQLRIELADDGGCERGTRRRPPRHRVDLAIEVLVLDVARALVGEVLAERVVDAVRVGRHRAKYGTAAEVAAAHDAAAPPRPPNAPPWRDATAA